MMAQASLLILDKCFIKMRCVGIDWTGSIYKPNAAKVIPEWGRQ